MCEFKILQKKTRKLLKNDKFVTNETKSYFVSFLSFYEIFVKLKRLKFLNETKKRYNKEKMKKSQIGNISQSYSQC